MTAILILMHPTVFAGTILVKQTPAAAFAEPSPSASFLLVTLLIFLSFLHISRSPSFFQLAVSLNGAT